MCFILNILTRFLSSVYRDTMFSVMHSIVQSQAVQFCAMLFIFLVLPPLAQSCQLKMNNLVQFFKNLCEVH